MNEAVLIASGVSKSFDRRFVVGGYTTFKTQLIELFRPEQRYEQIKRRKLEVLKDMSFEVRRGETLGIIGRNGAGKSTILKLLTGIYKPTSGKIERHGRISALLELGAGFHPDFSGRENIYINGMILGLSKKRLREKEAEIIAFAELEEHIDAPVRTYSSGMYMRLAFAIAVNVDPDILIIDEILAVGDEHFQHKSRAKLEEFKQKNVAIVLVTHALDTVQSWCTKAMWIDEGRVAALGEPDFVVGQYRAKVAQLENNQRTLPTAAAPTASTERWGDQKMVVKDVMVLDGTGHRNTVLKSQEPFSVVVDFDVMEEVADIYLAIGLWSSDGVCLFGANSAQDGIRLPPFRPGRHRLAIRLDSAPINARAVRLDVALENTAGVSHDHRKGVARIDFVTSVEKYGIVDMKHGWLLGDQHLAPGSDAIVTTA